MFEHNITFDRFIFGLVVFIGILVLINRLSDVLLPFFIACLIAYLIYPLVSFKTVYLLYYVRYSVLRLTESNTESYLKICHSFLLFIHLNTFINKITVFVYRIILLYG